MQSRTTLSYLQVVRRPPTARTKLEHRQDARPYIYQSQAVPYAHDDVRYEPPSSSHLDEDVRQCNPTYHTNRCGERPFVMKILKGGIEEKERDTHSDEQTTGYERGYDDIVITPDLSFPFQRIIFFALVDVGILGWDTCGRPLWWIFDLLYLPFADHKVLICTKAFYLDRDLTTKVDSHDGRIISVRVAALTLLR